MADHHGSVGLQGDLSLEAVLVLRELCLLVFGFLVCLGLLAVRITHRSRGRPLGITQWRLSVLVPVGSCLVKALVSLLEEGYVVIELHEIEGAREVELPCGVDRVAHLHRVFCIFASTHPVVCGVVGTVDVHPVEYRDELEGRLVGEGEGLLIVERCAHVEDALPYGVLPCVVAVGVEVLVDRRIRLFDLRVGGTLEVHVQILCEVPAKGEFAVPKELRVPRDGQRGVVHRLQVALLQLIVGTRQLRVEADVLRQPVEPEALGDVEPFALVLQLLERFPGLV